jgi:hypothetical protein
MAKAAVEHNVHARVFPPKAQVAPLVRAKSQDPWDALRSEIQEWKAAGGSGEFWVRDDDATTPEPRLIELSDLCEREHIPLTLAVIPLPMSLELVEMISRRGHLTPIQHGFDHVNREGSTDRVKSEFPADRNEVEALRSIQLGWYVLSEAFGERALPVFCPPWGTMAPKFRDQLKHLGFTGYSGSRMSIELHRQGTTPEGMRLASAHVAVNRAQRSGGEPLSERRVLEVLTATVRAIRTDRANEPVGIMTHHWGVDETVRHFLMRLFDETRKAGATWVGAKELFCAPRPFASAEPLQSDPSLRSVATS